MIDDRTALAIDLQSFYAARYMHLVVVNMFTLFGSSDHPSRRFVKSTPGQAATAHSVRCCSLKFSRLRPRPKPYQRPIHHKISAMLHVAPQLEHTAPIAISSTFEIGAIFCSCELFFANSTCAKTASACSIVRHGQNTQPQSQS
jgi:hypothetical protein